MNELRKPPLVAGLSVVELKNARGELRQAGVVGMAGGLVRLRLLGYQGRPYGPAIELTRDVVERLRRVK